MTDVVTLSGGNAVTMTSREIAELTRKEHFHVMRDIRTMLGELGLAKKGYIQNWRHPQNGQVYEEFALPKDLTITLVSGYSVAMRHRIVTRWQQLEAQMVGSAPVLPANYADALRALADNVEQTQRIEAERDEAVRTKALIGSKREATAMATAAAAVKEVNRLTDELGRNVRHATIIAVEKALGRKFGKQDWRPLREFCRLRGLASEKVTDPRYGEVKAWPAEAWRAVYGVDLAELFPARQAELH